jgi:D-amino-acid oxidase
LAWWAKEAFSFRNLTIGELTKGIYSGCVYDAFTIDVPKYLHNLGKEAKDFGGGLLQASCRSTEVFPPFLDAAGDLVEKIGKSINAYVDATGLNSGKIVSDENVYIIRGQTVVVRGEASRLMTTEDINPPPGKLPYITYVSSMAIVEIQPWEARSK